MNDSFLSPPVLRCEVESMYICTFTQMPDACLIIMCLGSANGENIIFCSTTNCVDDGEWFVTGAEVIMCRPGTEESPQQEECVCIRGCVARRLYALKLGTCTNGVGYLIVL